MSARRYVILAILFASLTALVATGEAESGLLHGLQAAIDEVHPIAREAHSLSDEDLALIAGVWQGDSVKTTRP